MTTTSKTTNTTLAFPGGCELNVVISLKTYNNGKKYYYIDYSQTKGDIEFHPFYMDGRLQDGWDGEIIAQNSMTDSMIKMLCMSDDKLREECGNTDVSHYRKLIMYNINELWD